MKAKNKTESKDSKWGEDMGNKFIKICRQIYARIWYYLQCFRLLFIRIPETPDGKSQEQLLQEILDRTHKREGR